MLECHPCTATGTVLCGQLEERSSKDADTEYDLFDITGSMDWYDAEGTMMAADMHIKSHTPDVPLGPGQDELQSPLPYLSSVPEDPQSGSGHSCASMLSLRPSFAMEGSTQGNSVLHTGASPAAHLLGRDPSGTWPGHELQVQGLGTWTALAAHGVCIIALYLCDLRHKHNLRKANASVDDVPVLA